MTDHDLDALARAARRKRRLPPDAACAACATTDHLSRRPDGRYLCYTHLRQEAGASPVEKDHVAGWVNLGGVLVQVWGNDHRAVEELRTQLGSDEWPPADGDPLLIIACLRLHGRGPTMKLRAS